MTQIVFGLYSLDDLGVHGVVVAGGRREYTRWCSAEVARPHERRFPRACDAWVKGLSGQGELSKFGA